MDLPFLSNSQIEELDSLGYIEVTEDLLEDLINWCRNLDAQVSSSIMQT